jgi:hypothetical protein
MARLERPGRRDPIIAPFHVIGFDPGGTTGWAQVIYDPNILRPASQVTLSEFKLQVGEFGPQLHHNALFEFMTEMWADYRRDLPPEFVTEPFNYRQYSDGSRSNVELISCEYIGVMKLFVSRHREDLPYSPMLYDRFNASMAKNSITNEKLDKMGWLQRPATTTERHKNDALRQVVQYLTVMKKIHTPITSTWRDDVA